MNKWLVACSLWFLIPQLGFARDNYTHSYIRRDGTAVQGYHHTTPDNSINNNYGTQGNLNPYTGNEGLVPKNDSQPQGGYNTGNGLGGFHQPKTHSAFGQDEGQE